jgi:hypothetical protein
MEIELYVYESLSGMFPSDIATGHFANSVYVIGMTREAEPKEIDKFHLVDKGIMKYQAFLDKY